MGYTIGMPSIKLNNVGQKSKHCGSFKKVAEEALAERLGLDLDINKELTSQNIYKGFRTAEDLMQYSAEHIAEMDYNRPEGTRKIRSDAVVMCGTILKPPAEMMINLSREEQQKFLEDAVEDFSKIVREDNIKSVVLHFDERVPHAHVFWEPMTEDGRLCAKEMHNLKFFGRLNREMPEMLRKQGWDIDNCQAYDKAEEDKKREEMGEEKYREYRKEKRKNRGQDSKDFKEIAEKKLQETNEKIATAQEELDGINAQIAESKQEKSKVEQQTEELKKALSEQLESSRNVIQNLFDKAKGGKKLTPEEVEQFNAVVGCLDTLTELQEKAIQKDKELGEKMEKLKKKIDETNTEIIAFKKDKSELSKEKNKLEKDKKKLEEEKQLFKKNKNFIIAAEGQRRAEQILESYGIRPEGYGIDEQIQQAQRAEVQEQEQKGAEK